MPHTTTTAALTITILAAAGLSFGCSSGGGDEASKFVGNWTFNTGSNITAVCSPPLNMTINFDLAGREVSITKIDDANIRVFVGQSCSVNFHVDGSTATAGPNQVCTLTVTVMGMPMNQSIMISNWTLMRSAEGALATTLAGSVAGFCTATGTGALAQSAVGADGGGQ